MAVDTLLIHGLNARLGVSAVHKGKINPIYTLRSQLISQRHEHLKLLRLKRVSKTLTLHEILSQHNEQPANANGNQEK
jgi:hypothetical protein